MTNHAAQRTRGIGEQIALNRRAVGFAHDASTYGTMNASDWDRGGLLDRLRKHAPRHVAR
jgi:hypothetical protein